MKLNKKAVTISTFLLGVMIFATFAFADTILSSGYIGLKDSMKSTAAKLTSEVDNYSFDTTFTLKMDGNVFSEESINQKVSTKDKSTESITKSLEKGKVTEYYSYSDKKQSIYKFPENDFYEVYKNSENYSEADRLTKNPFEEEAAKDMEKIFDALIGSLQDSIQIEESSGKKMYIGNLSESEIPSIVNAIASFGFKYTILDEWSAKNWGIPQAKSDVYLKDASGKAIENKDGILESGIFTASIAGKDDKGVEHTYTLEFSINIKDVNNTVVNAPNLEGQKVEYVEDIGNGMNSKYIGKYKSYIIEEKGESLEKVGERFVEISSIKDGKLKGKYYEVYNEGYKEKKAESFDFSGEYDESMYSMVINYTNSEGKKQKGIIDPSDQYNIYVTLNVELHEDGGYSSSNEDGFYGTFIREFE